MLLKVWHTCVWLWGWLPYILPAIFNLILVLLGVVMSLPKLAEAIEDTPRYRKLLAAICLIAGFVGFAFDVSQRRSSDQINHQLLEDLNTSVGTLKHVAEGTKTSVDNTNTLVTSVSLEWAQLISLNANIANLNIKIEGARGNAKLLAKLQGEADAAKEQAAQSTKRIMVTLVPQLIQEVGQLHSAFQAKMNIIREPYDDRMGGPGLLGGAPSQEVLRQYTEKQKLETKTALSEYQRNVQDRIRIADYLRQQMLEGLDQTAEDKAKAAQFSAALNGDMDHFDVVGAMICLDKLLQRYSSSHK